MAAASSKRRKLDALFKGTCSYCGHAHDDGVMTVDHVIPDSKGGGLNWGNVLISCHRCNGTKGAKDPSNELVEYAQMIGLICKDKTVDELDRINAPLPYRTPPELKNFRSKPIPAPSKQKQKLERRLKYAANKNAKRKKSGRSNSTKKQAKKIKLKALFNNKCFNCEKEFKILRRLDCGKGHYWGNIVPVCGVCTKIMPKKPCSKLRDFAAKIGQICHRHAAPDLTNMKPPEIDSSCVQFRDIKLVCGETYKVKHRGKTKEAQIVIVKGNNRIPEGRALLFSRSEVVLARIDGVEKKVLVGSIERD